jgi:hypothetical protein
VPLPSNVPQLSADMSPYQKAAVTTHQMVASCNATDVKTINMLENLWSSVFDVTVQKSFVFNISYTEILFPIDFIMMTYINEDLAYRKIKSCINVNNIKVKVKLSQRVVRRRGSHIF